MKFEDIDFEFVIHNLNSINGNYEFTRLGQLVDDEHVYAALKVLECFGHYPTPISIDMYELDKRVNNYVNARGY